MLKIPASERWLDQLGIRLQLAGGSGQWVSPDDAQGRGSVTLEEGRILLLLAIGRNVLEIGTGLGVSTLCLEQTAESITTIDPDPWVLEHVKLPERVIRLEKIDLARGPFDLAFIDGLHDTASVRKDIEDVRKLLHPSGLIVFHDTNQPPVRVAIDEVPWSMQLELPTSTRLMVCAENPIARLP